MDNGKGDIDYSKVINGGQGAKVPNNDALTEEKSKSVGSAKPAEKPFSDRCNVPEGQEVIG